MKTTSLIDLAILGRYHLFIRHIHYDNIGSLEEFSLILIVAKEDDAFSL